VIAAVVRTTATRATTTVSTTSGPSTTTAGKSSVVFIYNDIDLYIIVLYILYSFNLNG